MTTCTVCRHRAELYVDHCGNECCKRSYLGDCPAVIVDVETGASRLRPGYATPTTTTKGHDR